MKDSSITIKDLFCGAGGSSIGATKAIQAKGGKVAVAMNHWKLAIETHNTNFPDTLHDCTDIQACDPRRYPSTNILIASPECTNHSVAKGKKAVTAQLDLFDKGIIDPACERSRATMWDVPRFTEFHKYEIIIVENVVDARKWVQFPAWLHAMDLLGYNHKCVYANSMHFQPCPQSRDRMYVVFWKKGNRKPNLEMTPKAYCQKCGCDIDSVQAWKNPSKKFGKYKQQYIYICPECVNQVEPYYYAAFNVIDWSNIGTRIGDRKKPLSDNTERRIRHGLEKYGKQPFQVVNYTPGTAKHISDPVGTCTTIDHNAICTPMIIKGEHTLVDGMVKSSLDSMQTQCTRQTMSLVTPFIINIQQQTGVDFRVKSMANVVPTQSTGASLALALPYIVEMNSSGKAKPITNPTSTFTAGGVNHSLVTPESYRSFIHSHYGQTTLGSISDAIGTQTTKDRHSIVSYQEPKYEDCFYRMLFPREVQAAMAFESDYIVLGSGKDQVKQLGNAVTPPAMEWLVSRCVESLEN
jgi:DNA (cytosine-5)-methyltransferase 1